MSWTFPVPAGAPTAPATTSCGVPEGPLGLFRPNCTAQTHAQVHVHAHVRAHPRVHIHAQDIVSATFFEDLCPRLPMASAAPMQGSAGAALHGHLLRIQPFPGTETKIKAGRDFRKPPHPCLASSWNRRCLSEMDIHLTGS